MAESLTEMVRLSDRRQSGVFQAKHPTFFDAFEKKWFKTEKICLNDKDIEGMSLILCKHQNGNII